jgi:hypothetical protein
MKTVVAMIVLVVTCGLLACGGTEEDKLERGLTVGREEAVPGSDAEFDMTEAERQRQDAEEDAREEGVYE